MKQGRIGSRIFNFALLLAMIAAALSNAPAQAATRTVNNTNDSGAGSLRQAIASAISGDTIVFHSSLSGAEIHLASPLEINKNLIIDGSALAAKISISGDTDNNGAGDVRVFRVFSGSTVTMKSLIVRYGYVSGDYGGGIYNEGTLTLQNSVVTNNVADFVGGGIYNSGSFYTENSEISYNTSGTSGGGLYNDNGYVRLSQSDINGNTANDVGGAIYTNLGTVNIVQSVVRTNQALFLGGGGIYNFQGTVSVVNSSLGGNIAPDYGGGIYNYSGSELNLHNSAIADSTASVAGGIYNETGATLNFSNTIIAYSSAGDDCLNFGTIGTNANNLVEDGFCSPLLSGDPRLSFIADHGGPTVGYAIASDSPAIDAGNAYYCAYFGVADKDQRGAARPSDGDSNGTAACDIGPYEFLASLSSSAGANDGWVLESSETSAAGGTMDASATTINLGDDASDRQYRSVLSFNTASIPDNAVISQVMIKVRRSSVVGGGNPVSMLQGFMVDVRKGSFGPAALALGDFQAVANKTVGPLTVGVSGGWYTLDITTAKSFVNKLGLTQIRLRFKLDDNNNNVANILRLYSGNAGAASRPKLIVQYDIP